MFMKVLVFLQITEPCCRARHHLRLSKMYLSHFCIKWTLDVKLAIFFWGHKEWQSNKPITLSRHNCPSRHPDRAWCKHFISLDCNFASKCTHMQCSSLKTSSTPDLKTIKMRSPRRLLETVLASLPDLGNIRDQWCMLMRSAGCLQIGLCDTSLRLSLTKVYRNSWSWASHFQPSNSQDGLGLSVRKHLLTCLDRTFLRYSLTIVQHSIIAMCLRGACKEEIWDIVQGLENVFLLTRTSSLHDWMLFICYFHKFLTFSETLRRWSQRRVSRMNLATIPFVGT